MESNRIAEEFRRYFTVVPARTEELRRETYRIRYKVYADELGWEDRTRFPEGLETDGYDANSIACLLQHRESAQLAGCVRLIMGGADTTAPFPFEQAMRSAGQVPDLAALGPAWRGHSGEISRVAVVSEFRRRRSERDQPAPSPEDEDPVNPERRVFPHIAMGLYLGAAAMGLERGLGRVFAIMEPKLTRRLRIYGIEFDPVGEPLEHHGLRIPYCLERKNFERNMAPPIRALLEQILKDLSA